ncbi:MAG: FmdB family zinc ribbon protein, partial [Phycisphaerae bacterium]
AGYSSDRRMVGDAHPTRLRQSLRSPASMPTYEYACDACSHEFEQFQSITAGPLKKCPSCGKSKLRRLISIGGAVLFKGSGFYETDYRSEAYTKAKEADSKPATDTSAKKDADTTKSSADSKATDSKPTDSKAAESKSTDSKPAKEKSDAKPAKPEPPTKKSSRKSA